MDRNWGKDSRCRREYASFRASSTAADMEAEETSPSAARQAQRSRVSKSLFVKMLLLFKLEFELFQSCPEPGLDSAQRHPGDLGNLPQGQLLTEPE